MSPALSGGDATQLAVGQPLPAIAAVTLVTGQRVRLDVGLDGQ